MSLICLIHAHIEPRTNFDLWTFVAGLNPSQAEQSHLASAVAGPSANDSKQSSAMEAVIAAEAEDLSASLHGNQSLPVGTQILPAGTQILAAGTKSLPAGLAEQNMAQGKAASPSIHACEMQSAQRFE